ncbi:hypothetical protein F4806DRAFT_493325 [Annulohypoxylon nitens]|nr:hypothetical protein F4806DRAFT_493325 [Annulohypoxylon nitens]KAI1440901.1 hypothetical protein F5Y02DRAFT_422543 [Annulohypoxylon stygium]
MVQIATVIVAFTAVLSGFASAKSCKNGGVYCGTALIHRGDYHDDIVTQLQAHRQSTDEIHVQQSLFGCGKHGQITFRQYCSKGCVGGDKKDDYCS